MIGICEELDRIMGTTHGVHDVVVIDDDSQKFWLRDGDGRFSHLIHCSGSCLLLFMRLIFSGPTSLVAANNYPVRHMIIDRLRRLVKLQVPSLSFISTLC